MIDVVVLAAGASRRFGSDKLLADVGGRPLLAVTLDAVTRAVAAERVLVVVAPDQHERCTIVESYGARVVPSPHAARGMRWSIHAGLDQVATSSPGAVVLLGDDPLAALQLSAVLDRAAREPGGPVAVRRIGGTPHPVYLPRAAWPAAPTKDDDSGLRAVLGRDVRWIDAPDDNVRDIDRPGDVEALASIMRVR